MSARTAKATLADALKKLAVRWERIQPLWDDQARRDFQRDAIDPLPGKIEAASKGIEHVLELMTRARRECEDVTD